MNAMSAYTCMFASASPVTRLRLPRQCFACMTRAQLTSLARAGALDQPGQAAMKRQLLYNGHDEEGSGKACVSLVQSVAHMIAQHARGLHSIMQCQGLLQLGCFGSLTTVNDAHAATSTAIARLHCQSHSTKHAVSKHIS